MLKSYYVGAGSGTSERVEKNVSMDAAMVDAGVGSHNIVRTWSVLPANCDRANYVGCRDGELLPCIFAVFTSERPGDTISSGVAIGYPVDDTLPRIVLEKSAHNYQAVKTSLRAMMQEVFDARGWELKRVEMKIASETVPAHGAATTFACVAMW